MTSHHLAMHTSLITANFRKAMNAQTEMTDEEATERAWFEREFSGKLSLLRDGTEYVQSSTELAWQVWNRRANLTKPDAGGGEAFTTGHCVEKAKPGGCQHHNLQCGYPDCDRRPVAPPSDVPAEPSVVPMPEPVVCDTCGNSGFVAEYVNGVPIGECCPDCPSSPMPVIPEPDGYIWRGTVLKENWKFSGPEDKDQMNYMVEYRYNGVSTYEVKPVYFKPVRQVHTDTEGE
jgi:hypothetical protein